MDDLVQFHTSSIWTIEPTSTFESCFSGSRNGSIYHTDLVGDSHTLLYQVNNTPINSITFDEENQQLWFTSSTDSSLKCLDLHKRNLDKISNYFDESQTANLAGLPSKGNGGDDINF